MASVLSRELDSYQNAMAAYRRKYGNAVEEQNVALQDLQNGRRTLIPTEDPTKYVIANGVDQYGNFNIEKKKVGGFLGMGGQKVPRVVTANSPEEAHAKTGLRILPKGPTEELMGDAPVAPDPSMAQIRAAQRPSLAEAEAGLIGQVLQGKGVRTGTMWNPPDSIAQQMYDRAHPKPVAGFNLEQIKSQFPNFDPSAITNALNGTGKIP